MPAILSSRVITIVCSFLGAVGNGLVAGNIISLCRSLRWEVVESEWDESYASWNFGIDTIKIVWALLSIYFTVSAVACLVGFVGALKQIKSAVKLYRDYSVADLSVSALSTLLFCLASLRAATRAAVCEELSRQPELMRNLAEAGLDIENCEPWFEHAAVVIVGLMAVVLVVRLQFALAVSNYYTQMKHHRMRYHSIEDAVSDEEATPQRIFLLPTRAGSRPTADSSDVLIYAPVPLSTLSPQETHDLDAAEAWLTRSEHRGHSGAHSRRSSDSKSPSPPRRHHHSRRHSSNTAHIRLPISPDEPLLPEYSVPDHYKA